MFYYLSSLIYVYIISRYFNKLPTIFIFISLFPIILFAAFRGNSGKDTPIYIDRFFGQNIEYSFFSEPIFSLIISASRFISDSSLEIFFAIHASLVCMLYSKIIKSNNAFAVTLGPLFLIDGLTNGMRIVIGYFLLLVFSNNFLRSLSFFAHISSLLPLLIAFISDNRNRLVVAISVPLLIIVIFLVIDIEVLRVSYKLNRYQSMGSANWYSGIVDLLILFILITRLRLKNLKVMFISFLLICVLLFLNMYSIAFIRLTKLLILSLFLIPSTRAFLVRNKTLAFTLFFISVINFMRQVVFGQGFLPYG